MVARHSILLRNLWIPIHLTDPVQLWNGLHTYFDTTVNRANVLVLLYVRTLLNLRLLDPDFSGSSCFVSDFRDCIQCLRKNTAKLADDSDTLCAFLMVAIQYDACESNRDSIAHKPCLSLIDDILT